MDKAIVCDLNAIPLEQRESHTVLTRTLFAQVEERRALVNGYSFRFPASLFQMAAQFISLERLCCPFFTFNLDVEGEYLWLRLTGPQGAKELLKTEFGIAP
jgi:hypothetical protein